MACKVTLDLKNECSAAHVILDPTLTHLSLVFVPIWPSGFSVCRSGISLIAGLSTCGNTKDNIFGPIGNHSCSSRLPRVIWKDGYIQDHARRNACYLHSCDNTYSLVSLRLTIGTLSTLLSIKLGLDFLSHFLTKSGN